MTIALIAGATGLVGRECLKRLTDEERATDVPSPPPRPLPVEGRTARVKELRTQFDDLADHPGWFRVDWVFCALGTTMKTAGSREAFRRVDFDYPLGIARAARDQGASHFLLVSAMGANPRSPIFYNRVKGELEDAVQELGFASLTIARPSLLLGDRREWRAGEEIAKRVGWLFPSRSRPVQASQVALALVRAAHSTLRGTRFLENRELRQQPSAGQ
jgi:uncharacterized protein YbjT (DUF2867 family)